MIFIYALIVMGVLGLLLGLFLVIAEKFLAVKVDPRYENIMEVLPQVNCGACGYSGCAGYADAMVVGTETDFTKCAPGGPDIIVEIDAYVRGVAIPKDEADDSTINYRSESIKKKVKSFKKSMQEKSKVKYATLNCNGGTRAKDRHIYSGIDTCESAHVMYGGQKGCVFGCLSFGDCDKACPFDAITMGEDGLPKVDKALCTGCGICVDACPKNILELMPANTAVVIACSNTEIGGHVKKNCEVACIACKRCAKACPEKAIEMVDNLAVIDYSKCTGCGKCVKVCPTKAIMVGYESAKISPETISNAFRI
ncbi:MAG: RnfABCDGE type electron transport complex subunit B [Planctomycetes bacterium]|nr:RnfABCDGE type electron transport complex subunit B [Planctomycetota bacterium]